MLIYILFIFAGLVGLYYGTERFIDGIVAIGSRLNLSNTVLGLVVLSAATSFPEMLTSAKAALEGHPTLGVGNAVGSNIANIFAVAGTLLLLSPIAINAKLHVTSFSILAIASIAALLALLDLYASHLDGILLLVGFFVFLFILYRFPHKFISDDAPHHGVKLSLAIEIVLLIGGFLLIFASIETLINGAVRLAMLLGISDLVIGLTIIAVGTSLPELAAVVSCVARRKIDLALATVVGSNIMNIFGAMGLCLVIHPAPMPTLLLWRDLPVMLVATLMLVLFARGNSLWQRRLYGVILLACFASYLLALYFSANYEPS
ncbi:MAG: calcium/sodium antiporter [Candidatus Porifericomitaceae bacterium WSBS_2022_MAG_OTU9]